MADAKLALSGVAACVAEGATFPLDVLKARMQLHPGRAPPGLAATALQVLRHEGPAALYSGIAPALLRHLPYTSIRVALFEQLRDRANATWGGHPPPGSTLAAGLVAGGAGQLAAVPADLIKLRIQADARAVAVGQRAAPRYRGVAHAFGEIIRQEGGVRALWRGGTPAVQRAALVNLGELSTYDAAKRAVLRSGLVGGDGLPAHALSAAASGLVSSLVSTPADVIKTRLMSQDPAAPRYRGMADCFVQTWRGEGARGLYKGFLPTWARLAPWQLVFWVTFEQLRALSGMQGF